MANPLFSTYRQGEDRVTSTILAVFERLSFNLVERILQELCQEPETSLLTFRNQPHYDHAVPDALIRASFAYWIETKIAKDAVHSDQLLRHLEAMDTEHDISRRRLLVLTPDDRQPDVVTELHDARVAWANFDALARAIADIAETAESVLAPDQSQVSAQERFLLRELVQFLIAEGLVGRAQSQAVIVAARVAIGEYFQHGVYMCQPRRAFQACSHLGFFANGRIDKHIPAILTTVEAVEFTRDGVNACPDLNDASRSRLLDLVAALEHEHNARIGEKQKVILLSAPDDPKTLVLQHDIINNLKSETGRPVAFVMGQRYVPIARLKASPQTTTELLQGIG